MSDSLGKYLSSSRIKRGFSIADVAAITRINERFIRAVEDDRFDDLPGDVFIKGFLRTYATQLGLDGDELVTRYIALHIEHTDQSPNLISIPLRPKSSRAPVIALIIILMAIGALAYYHYQEKDIFLQDTKSGVTGKQPARLMPEKGKDAVQGIKNKNIRSGKKIKKPEKAKVSNHAATEFENILVPKKMPTKAKAPKINEPAKEKDAKVNVVIP